MRTAGLAGGAEIFDDPFVARDCFGHRLFHQLLFRIDSPAITGVPVRPPEMFGLGAGGQGIAIRSADHFAVVMIGAAGAGGAEVFALIPPACGRDLLLFTDQSADLRAVVAAESLE